MSYHAKFRASSSKIDQVIGLVRVSDIRAGGGGGGGGGGAKCLQVIIQSKLSS